MITGQDEEAARKWEEYQKRNRPASQPTKTGKLFNSKHPPRRL